METTLKSETTLPNDIIDVEYDPLLIIAGPGTGKSTKLAERAKRLLDKHLVEINNLFVLSFSNESVNDLREKLDRAKVPNDVWCSTVHKLAYKVLFENLGETDMNDSFTITDREDDILILQDSNSGAENLLYCHKIGKGVYLKSSLR